MDDNKITEAFIAWPGWPHFLNSAKLSALFFILFYSIYGATDYVTSLHSYRINAYFDWELQIPRMTWMSLVYLSISPLLLLAPFIIRGKDEFNMLFKIMLFETIIASALFLILPMEDAYRYQKPQGFFGQFYLFADKINLTYNELPSLHVAFAFTAAIFYGQKAKQSYKVFLMIWAILIAISTLVTHQHHVSGVLSGILLAWFTLRFFGYGNKN